MKKLKYILWSPIFSFIAILIFGIFGVIWDYKFSELLCKIWVTLGMASFFCLGILSTIDKAEKLNNNNNNNNNKN